MKKTAKRIIFTALMLIAAISAAGAITFDFHTFKARVSPEFAEGVYPVSLLYQFDFPVPDIMEGQATEFNFRVDNGMDFRTLRQTPNEGIPFASNPDKSEWQYPRTYLTIYDEMNFVFLQGFLDNQRYEDLIELWVSFDMRFENAYERLDWYTSPATREGLFLISPQIDSETPAVERFPESSWIGQPELIGGRSTSNMSFSLGFNVDWMDDRITKKDGVKFKFWTRLNPAWFDAFGSNTQDFILLGSTLDLAWTPLSFRQNGEREIYWCTMMIENNTEFRGAYGSKIPYYAQRGYIFGAQALNAENIITNRTSLSLFGPQINSYDCYPRLMGFFDIGYAFGSLLNSSSAETVSDVVMSAGMRIDFRVFDIAEFYYEIGYIIDNVLEEAESTIMRLGFSFGV